MRRLIGSSFVVYVVIFMVGIIWQDAHAQQPVLSYPAECHHPVLVWHQETLPEQMVLSSVQKEFPDMSERWGVQKCGNKPIYSALQTGQKIQLPTGTGDWDVSEGTIKDGIWSPEIRSQPRIAWLRRHINNRFEYTLYGISAPAEIPVRTEPNTSVTVSVGNKIYGPVMANGEGLAQMRVQIPPTVSTAVIALENNIGERSENQLDLTSNHLVVSHWQLGVHGYHLNILTYNPNNHSPFPIQCEGGVVLQDLYHSVVIPNEAEILSCSALGSRITLPDRPNASVPVRLKLDTFPRIMSTDRPIAKVQLEAFDSEQNSLDPKGLMLTADIGNLDLAIVDNALLADYNGANAQLLGGDTLTATWNQPGHNGDPYSFECLAYRDLSERFLKCKLLSKSAKPVSQKVAHFRSDQNIMSSQTTDANGRLKAVKVPLGTQFVSISSDDFMQRFYIEPIPPDGIPSENELQQRQHLIITSGAVREIKIETSQPVHELNSNKPTKVQVELYDITGQMVKDENIFLTVSDGEISEPERNANGSYTARYQASGNIQYGTVKIMASALNGAYTASTSLQITPNQLIRGIGITGGMMGVNSMPLSYNTRIYMVRRSPLGEKIYGSFGIERVLLQSYDSGYRINQTLVPITMGISYRSTGRRLGSYLDGLMAVNPYKLQVLYTENSILNSWGMTYPGFEMAAGTRYRQGNSEFTGGFRFMSIPFSTDSIGWNQQFTAILFEGGYFWSF
ncbi:MAG: hypothetical protein ACON4U_01425 [Myxococcota bacterium]